MIRYTLLWSESSELTGILLARFCDDVRMKEGVLRQLGNTTHSSARFGCLALEGLEVPVGLLPCFLEALLYCDFVLCNQMD